MLFTAAVKGLDSKKAKAKTEKLLDMVNLHDVADKKIKWTYLFPIGTSIMVTKRRETVC